MRTHRARSGVLSRRAALAVVAALAFSGVVPAIASGINDKVTAITVAATSGNCLPQSASRVSLTIDATAASAAIGYCETAGSQCTATIGAAGTTTLAAGTLHYWPAGSAPNASFCFVTGTPPQPLTIREGTL